MFSVSNNDFMAALALQSEIASPVAKVKPRVRSPFVATRVNCSRATSTATRNEARDVVKLLGDAAGIGEQTIDGDERRDGRKNGEQAIVGHAGGEREDAVLADVAVDPPEDVLPSPRRYLGGRTRLAPRFPPSVASLGGRGVSLGFSGFRERFCPLPAGRPGRERCDPTGRLRPRDLGLSPSSIRCHPDVWNQSLRVLPSHPPRLQSHRGGWVPARRDFQLRTISAAANPAAETFGPPVAHDRSADPLDRDLD